ncbi:hypothetical protein FSP39_020635 [Pinctada imbricata]|uniref:Ion transport domain-containing protein n=1 Tax=Pinctada imbricata TaxID=66713 RepID=A0AA88YEU6_PINIB|nr:hypothetical protein FSP39_020635 [Pinctada imbricata]
MWRYSNIICSMYPLLALDSIGPRGETNWNSALMIIINGETDEHLDMLQGGVIRQLLDEKWKTFARKRFFMRLILALIHLALISASIYTRPGSHLLSYNSSTDAIRFVCEILTCIGCAIVLVLDCIEIWSQGLFSFLKNCRHEPTQTIFMLSCIMILACIPFRILEHKITEDILLIIAVPGSWFFLLFFARGKLETGPMVVMMETMILTDVSRFMIIFLIFLAQFSTAFYFLFQGANISQGQGFSNLLDTVLTLFQMTLGEFKYQEFNLTKYSGLTKMVFAVFMLLVPILLLNMLIAMMGNTYSQVIAKSEKEWHRQWAKIVVVLERGFSKKNLLQYQKEYAIKLVGKPKDNLAEITDDQVEEQRALVVIKTSTRTKAKQRKGAVHNWKTLGKEVIKQIKKQRIMGIKGPVVLTAVNRRRKGSIFHGSHDDSSDDDSTKGFSHALQQIAWQKDIDLTKGHAFISDPDVIEKHSPRLPDKTESERSSVTTTSHSNQIPNGKPRTSERIVKKPAGTPKSSPASSVSNSKQFSYNRVSPLTLTKQPSPTDESSSDLEGSKPLVGLDLKGMSVGDISLHWRGVIST